jgi:hypothetical protein
MATPRRITRSMVEEARIEWAASGSISATCGLHRVTGPALSRELLKDSAWVNDSGFTPVRSISGFDKVCRCGKRAMPRKTTCGDVACLRATSPREERCCGTCGAVFEVRNSSTKQFCSSACGAGVFSVVRWCSICKKSFERNGARATCSDDCKSKATSPLRKGERRRATERRAGYRGKNKQKVLDLLIASDPACAVCGLAGGLAQGDGSGELVLDHCHKSKLPRALLCRNCNAALGLMKEDSNLIVKLAEYALWWNVRMPESS